MSEQHMAGQEQAQQPASLGASHEQLQQYNIPLYVGEPLSEEQRAERARLRATFAEMESKQLEFLDESGKNMIGLVTAMLTVLFGVLAFGDNFPPKYLVNHPWNSALLFSILSCYLLAMVMSMCAIIPRNYRYRERDFRDLQRTWQRIIGYKQRWIRLGGLLFGLGTVLLAALIVSIVTLP